MTALAARNSSAEATLRRLEGKMFGTVPEIALVLRCDPRTLRKEIAEGKVPAVRTGNTYRVPTAWLRKQVALGLGADGGEGDGTAA